VYPVLALMLLAVAGFTVLVIRRSSRVSEAGGLHLESFGYVGAAVMLIMAGVVVVVGVLADQAASAEALAMVALFAFVLYMLVAYAITGYLSRRG
jgi:hypothetical protein